MPALQKTPHHMCTPPPTTMEAAAAAHHPGRLVGMGAPNVLRGRSSGGNLSAIDAIRAGHVDWLCADYYPAAMIPAAFALVDQGLLDLSSAIALITANPAQAIGSLKTLIAERQG